MASTFGGLIGSKEKIVEDPLEVNRTQQSGQRTFEARMRIEENPQLQKIQIETWYWQDGEAWVLIDIPFISVEMSLAFRGTIWPINRISQ
jgi:hypothetical protein